MRGFAVALILVSGCGRLGFGDDSDNDTTEDLVQCSTDIALLGTAVCAGGTLQLTQDMRDTAGAIWWMVPVPTDADVTVETTWSSVAGINGQDALPGDGTAIVFQADPMGANALGENGQGLGFGMLQPSLAAEIDLYGNPEESLLVEHIGIDVDGDVNTGVAVPSPVPLVGAPVTTWIEYEHATHRFSIRIAQSTQRPSVAALVGMHDMSRLGPTMYVGLTGGTGGNTAIQTVTHWTIRVAP